jgi:hypothetical protein
MPWHTKSEGDEVVVVRDTDGKVVGRHPNKDKAVAHLRALYASEVIKSAMVADKEESRHQNLISFLKASFGGDRSAAGRYAAEQRWKGHKKADATASWNTPTDDLEVAKATGRPISWLQWGNIPNQDAFNYYLKTTQDVKQKIKEVEYWISKNGLVTKPYVVPTMEQVMAKRKELKELVNQLDQLEIEYGSELETFREECITRGMTDEESRIAMNAVQHLVDVYRNEKDATRSDSQREILAKDAVKNAEIMIAIPAGALQEILDDGRIKSQFETGKSGGYLGEEMRSGQETFAFGYHPRIDPTLRPIYGYVHNKKIRYTKAMYDVRQYGNVHIVLKDEIKNRTTFTSDDSLNQPMIPAPVNKPNKMAVHPSMSFSLYTEAQIHGGVSVSDIAKVVVSRDNYNNAYIAKLLKTAGIPFEIAGDDDFEKASFGGDRSAAGRYAAEQRWKGHVKDDIDSALDLQLPSLPVPTTEAGKEAQRIYSDQSFDDVTGMSPSGQWVTTINNVRRHFPSDLGIVDGNAYGTPAEDVLSPENLAKADAFIKENPMYSYSVKYTDDGDQKQVPYLELSLQIVGLQRMTHQRVDPSLPHAFEDTKQFLYERVGFSPIAESLSAVPSEQFDEEELILDTSPKNPSGIPPAALYRWERASSKKNPGVSEMPWCDSIGWHASEIAGLPEPYPKPDQSYRVYFQTDDSTLRLHAQDLLKAVSNAPAQQPTLWRGVGGSHQGEKATGNPDQLNVGDTFDLSLASTSRDVRQAAKYGSTWFRIEAGSKGIKIPSKQSAFAHDQEVITSGKFRVTSKETVTVRDSTDFYKAKRVLRDARTLLQGDPKYDAKIGYLVQRVVNLSNNVGSTRDVIGVVQEGTFPV